MNKHCAGITVECLWRFWVVYIFFEGKLLSWGYWSCSCGLGRHFAKDFIKWRAKPLQDWKNNGSNSAVLPWVLWRGFFTEIKLLYRIFFLDILMYRGTKGMGGLQTPDSQVTRLSHKPFSILFWPKRHPLGNTSNCWCPVTSESGVRNSSGALSALPHGVVGRPPLALLEGSTSQVALQAGPWVDGHVTILD